MSAVSGLNAKAEKGRSKYVALDINSIYKGKSLENPKAAVQPKHGLQSLGKVGTGRRMPPPANLPSLKSENSGNNPNISLVPSGGQGWGSTTKEKGKTEETNGNQQQSPQSQPASSLSQTSQKTSTTNTVATSGVSKTWSSVTSSQEDGGQERNFLGQQSPFFPQEFPKLAGGDVPTDGNQKSSADSQYGPGPSLRPQTEGSWGRGTLQQPLQSGSAGGLQQSSGSGVNGPQPSPDNQQPQPSSQQHLRDQRPYSTSRGPIPPGNIGNVQPGPGSVPLAPAMGPAPPLGHGSAMPVQMGPGSALHPPPQFRGMMPSFMYGRNNYPSAYPSNYATVPPPPQSGRQPYPYPENRRSQPVRPLGEEEAYQRPAAIITEKALKGFDEILQNDTQDTWATSHGEIDYNAKLVFSDDEEVPVSQKKDKREMEEKAVKSHSGIKNEKERDRKIDREKSLVKGNEERPHEVDWAKEGRSEKRNERDPEWSADRGENFERERDDRWKSLSQNQQGRPPTLNMDMTRQWQPSQAPQQRPFDYRGPPPQPPGSAYATPHGRIGPGPVPLIQHGSYPAPQRPSRPGPRTSVADDDEMWRQRRKQHSEMTMTVERARQRRAEEEKHYEQSKQCAQEKAKAFDKGEKVKENVDMEDPDRSRHSSESRDDKPPSRDGRERDRDRSQPNYQAYSFSKQFQKNVPPRFQKQAAELMRQQQTQQPIPLVSPQPGGHSHFLRSQPIGQTGVPGPAPHAVAPVVAGGHSPSQPPVPIGVNYDSGWSTHPPPYINQMTGLPTAVSKVMPRPRSNSQGSATDSYESDRCTPDQKVPYERETQNYWSRDRRQNSAGYDNWHSTGSTDGYYDKKIESTNKMYDQRSDFNRLPEKEEKSFDAHPRESDRREKDFENQDYRYNKIRDSFKDTHKQIDSRESKEKKANCWANPREYEDRVPQDPFEDTQDSSRDKPVAKERNERYDRADKDRPQRPDSRDSRTSRDSAKDDRHGDRHESQSTQPERERKNHSSREEKKEKPLTFDWGDSPYPLETKRREWHHHPPPITPKQFESIGPPKKNLTTLRRSNATAGSQNIPEKKSDTQKDDSCKKADLDLCLKKDKEAKEEKNEKIKSESSSKDSEKHLDDKFDQPHFEKLKTYGKDSAKKNDTDIDSSKKDNTTSVEEKEKSRNEKDKHEHQSSRNEQNRDRRRDGRGDRGGVNSRPRGGGNTTSSNNPSVGNSGGGGRCESNRSRGGGHSGRNNYPGNVGIPPNNSISGGGGGGSYRGKSREYRRSRVERGPRFDRQKERDKDKVKDDKKEKHSDDTSCSEVDDGKLGHLRQKDEDSEVSVDEASASTTESAQAEKYQNLETPQEDKLFITDHQSVVKDSNVKTDKYQKEKRDSSRKETKSYDTDRLKDDKGGFAPRGEPSRRGRGGGGTLSFRNSRGGPRHGPSSYGPPPSRAGFGTGKSEKIEEQKTVEEAFNDANQAEFKTNIPNVENANLFSRDTNNPRSLERPQQRRPNRFEHLPPRFQKRHDKRYDKYDQSYRGRGRGRNSAFQGSSNQISNKLTQGGKENLSDVANEEWETASESSDIAERRDRRGDKEDSHKKDSRDKAGSSSRKSFSSQRPMNESNQGRRMNNEPRRGVQNNGDRNRQRDGFQRDNRGRDCGRERQGGNFGNGADRRILNNSGNNSRPSSSAGHPGSVGGRNSGRSNNPSSKTGPFQPKNEGTATVYRVDEIKLQDPNSVQAALTDLTNRRNMKAEVAAAAAAKVPKTDKDKVGGLEGYDLNNYASVVIIDDHPEVEDTNVLCGADDGFQEVTSKKRHKVMIENEVKKMKKEPHSRNKSGSRSRQSKLPPRFAKQRELVKPVSIAPGTTWELNVDVNSKQSPSSVKDSSPAPPPSVNAWEKPINHSLRPHSPSLGVGNTPVSSICTNSNVAIVNPNSAISSDVQVLASSSKSSSFDRSDQHDSGIDVSDQPASAASSQRSSPSNDCKILTPTISGKGAASTEACSELVTDVDSSKPMCTVVFENKNFKAENAVLDKFGGQTKTQSKDITTSTCDTLVTVSSAQTKSKESTSETDDKSHCLGVNFPSKESFGKGEEGADMKLDFSFESGLEQLTDDKNTSNGTHITNKAVNMSRSMENSSTAVGVQSPISPSADDLNLKIASVKKVWENDPPLPTVMEHPQTSDDQIPTSYSSFSSNSDPSTNVYNSSVDVSSQVRKETDSTEMSFRENSPMQQACSNSGLVKSIDHNVSSVKSHMQIAQHNPMTGTHCAGPLSPPLMSGLEAMSGMRTIAGLASSVQVAGIPAIPSPPTVLFNSSQQMAQTGLYQPLQMDTRQNQAAAVAAAMVQYSQSPHGYAPLGTYGISHQPPPNPQLSNAYGQQSLFVQPSAAHQGQDIYSSNQFRVQPPYPQSQHVSSNQVLSAQQNMASSHLLGSQLVQTRATAGPSPAAPHLQGLHGIQAVQPGPQTSYFSTSAQPQTANFYHQPPTTPGSPMQQQPHFPSHQGYGSQSTLNVLPQAAAVTQNFRNFGNHQFKAASSVMNNMVPESSNSLRATTRSPTVDAATNRSMFGVSTAGSSTMNSSSVVTVPQISNSSVVGKIGQPQTNPLPASRLSSSTGKTSQFSMPQSQQHYYPFGQQKFGHVQSNTVRPQVLFPNVVRNTPPQHPAVAAASNLHYPPPIQRPGAAVAQPTPQPSAKVGIRPQANVMVPGGKLTTAQQAKLRAEAVQQTHMFFVQSKTGKHDENVTSMLSQDKGGIPVGSASKLTLSTTPDDDKEKQTFSSPSESSQAESKEIDGSDIPTVEE